MVSPLPPPPSPERRAAVAQMLRESGAESEPGFFHVVVRGHCMAPLLLDGQRVRVRARSWALPGDVVAFERAAGDAGLAVHRLLGLRLSRTGLVFITQPDNEAAPDPVFGLHRLVGVAEVPVSLRDRGRALLRFLPAALAPVTRRVPFGRKTPAARRAPVPVSFSASR